MEKIIGIIGDDNNELSISVNQEFSPKYKIYTYSFGSKSKLAFQTNDKELFIKEWAQRYSSSLACDDCGVEFAIDNFGSGCMNEKELRKYLENKIK
jgi:hypothetical protein